MIIKSFLKFINESMTIDDLKSQLNDINDILIDLRDMGWIIDVGYTPKRWEGPTYELKSDSYSITIKKKQNANQSRYPEGSFFKFKEIEDYILRLDEYFKNNEKNFISIIEDPNWKEEGFPPRTGRWVNIENKTIYEEWFSESDLLGFNMKIFIDGENVDNFKHHELVDGGFIDPIH